MQYYYNTAILPSPNKQSYIHILSSKRFEHRVTYTHVTITYVHTYLAIYICLNYSFDRYTCNHIITYVYVRMHIYVHNNYLLVTIFALMHTYIQYFVYITWCFNFCTCTVLASTAVSKASSRVMVHCSPQKQQTILIVSQPSSLVSIVSDTRTTTSPVTTLSVVECLTTSSSVVTSISGQHVSTITTTAGWEMYLYS